MLPIPRHSLSGYCLFELQRISSASENAAVPHLIPLISAVALPILSALDLVVLLGRGIKALCLAEDLSRYPEAFKAHLLALLSCLTFPYYCWHGTLPEVKGCNKIADPKKAMPNTAEPPTVSTPLKEPEIIVEEEPPEKPNIPDTPKKTVAETAAKTLQRYWKKRHDRLIQRFALPEDYIKENKISPVSLENRTKLQIFLWHRGYDHLLVPRAEMLGENPVEKPPSRLENFNEQLYLYAENAEAFTPAVEQFVRFYFQVNYAGKVNGYWEYYNKTPLTIENGIGKIWLPRPGHYKFDFNKNAEVILQKFISLHRMFPYHKDTIWQVAREIFSQEILDKFNENINDINDYFFNAKNFCDKMYLHLIEYFNEYFNKNGISKDNYHFIVTRHYRSKIVDNRRDRLVGAVSEYLSEKIKTKANHQKPNSNAELISCRTILIPESDIIDLVNQLNIGIDAEEPCTKEALWKIIHNISYRDVTDRDEWDSETEQILELVL